MDGWDFFDSFCVVGRHLKWEPGQPCTAEELLNEMDHYGIAEAMVLDDFSREFHPALGNRRASEIAAANPRLHAGWSNRDSTPMLDQISTAFRKVTSQLERVAELDESVEAI